MAIFNWATARANLGAWIESTIGIRATDINGAQDWGGSLALSPAVNADARMALIQGRGIGTDAYHKVYDADADQGSEIQRYVTGYREMTWEIRIESMSSDPGEDATVYCDQIRGLLHDIAAKSVLVSSGLGLRSIGPTVNLSSIKRGRLVSVAQIDVMFHAYVEYTGSVYGYIDTAIVTGDIEGVAGDFSGGIPTGWDSFSPKYRASTKSLLLDGNDRLAYLRPEITDYNFEYNDAFSVVFWYKTSSALSSIPIAEYASDGTGRGWFILLSPTTSIALYCRNTPALQSQVLIKPLNNSDGNWHQVVATKGNTSAAADLALYYDGALPTQYANVDTLGSNTLVDTAAPLCFGARCTALPSTGASSDFIGNIGDVAIYDKKLTLAEVTATRPGNKMTDLSIVGPTANLKGWWRLGEDPLPFAWDWSGNGNHAELWNIDSSMIVEDVP